MMKRHEIHNKTLVERLLGKRPLRRPRRSEDNIRETGYDGGNWMKQAQDHIKSRALVLATLGFHVDMYIITTVPQIVSSAEKQPECIAISCRQQRANAFQFPMFSFDFSESPDWNVIDFMKKNHIKKFQFFICIRYNGYCACFILTTKERESISTVAMRQLNCAEWLHNYRGRKLLFVSRLYRDISGQPSNRNDI